MALLTEHVSFAELRRCNLVGSHGPPPKPILMDIANELAQNVLHGMPLSDQSIREVADSYKPAIGQSGGFRQRIALYAEAIVKYRRSIASIAADCSGLDQELSEALLQQAASSSSGLGHALTGPASLFAEGAPRKVDSEDQLPATAEAVQERLVGLASVSNRASSVLEAAAASAGASIEQVIEKLLLDGSSEDATAGKAPPALTGDVDTSASDEMKTNISTTAATPSLTSAAFTKAFNELCLDMRLDGCRISSEAAEASARMISAPHLLHSCCKCIKGKCTSHCGHCKRVWYCDRTCQVVDWKSHKCFCKKSQSELEECFSTLYQDYMSEYLSGAGDVGGAIKRIKEFTRHVGPLFHWKSNDWTMLHHIANMWMMNNVSRYTYEGLVDLVSFTYEHGADVNAVTTFGDTPLHLACLNKAGAMVDFFLDQTPVNLGLRDKDGKTAEEVADGTGCPKLKAIFRAKKHLPDVYACYLAARLGGVANATHFIDSGMMEMVEVAALGVGFAALHDLPEGQLLLKEYAAAPPPAMHPIGRTIDQPSHMCVVLAL